MLYRQRGVLNLYWVAIFSAALAGVGMAALFSMRYERNLFAEGAAKVGKMFSASPVQGVVDSARSVAGASAGQPGGQLRKCVIDGKTVVSNTDCSDKNPTTKVIKIQDTRGFEAPKKPPEPAKEPGAPSMKDKMMENQLQ